MLVIAIATNININTAIANALDAPDSGVVTACVVSDMSGIWARRKNILFLTFPRDGSFFVGDCRGGHMVIGAYGGIGSNKKNKYV